MRSLNIRLYSQKLLSFGLTAGLALAACGGPEDSDNPIDDVDAAPDAALPEPCTATSQSCGYISEDLDAADLTNDEKVALAKRFNPALVFTDDVIYPTSFNYALEHNGGLFRAPIKTKGSYYMVLDVTKAEAVAKNTATDDLSDLPLKNAQNQDVAYYVDLPGDATGPGADEETWSTEWKKILDAGGDYKPTQYVHYFWLSRDDGLLAIQYFLWSPWDKFANNHEGDTEHLNVIVRKEGGDWRLVMAHFGFHAKQAGFLAKDIVRLADKDGGNGDHPVVFVGGKGCQRFGDATQYCGTAANAVLPYPGLYKLATDEIAAGGASLAPGRLLRPEDSELVILPPLGSPMPRELSWFGKPIIFGQLECDVNAEVTKAIHSHRAPLAPGPYHFEFGVGITDESLAFFNGDVVPEKFIVPEGWNLINDPTAAF